MRHRVRFSLSLLALFSEATATLSDELCEVTARAEGSSQSSALLQKAASSSLQLEVKHPDLTDGPVPWKPDTRKPAIPSLSSTFAASTTTSTPLASTTTFTTTTSITTTTVTILPTVVNATNISNASDASTTPTPIVVNTSNTSGVSNSSGGGCCFSYGFGEQMEPCCLKSSMVADRSLCPEENVIGSRTSFSPGACPSSPREAADLAEAASDALNAACTPGNSCGENVLPKDRGICIKPAEGSSACWDICDNNHLPEEYTLGDGDEDFHARLAQAVRDVREGRYPELSCPGGISSNESLSGDSYEDQLAAAATNASQADSMADEATAMAEQLLAEARNNFAKAMNDGATPDNLLAAARTWEDAAIAHAKAHDAAAIAAERIKALSQLLAKGSRKAAKELARKKEEARKKEAVASKKKAAAAKKRQEAEEAKELAIRALEEARRARAEANAAATGSINITYGEPPTNATMTWNATNVTGNSSMNSSPKVAVAE